MKAELAQATPPAAPFRDIEQNADGSAIVYLKTPIRLKGEEYERVTVPALRGKHMRKCPIVAGATGEVPVGVLVEFAAQVVLPEGAVDEMTSEDAIRCAVEVASKMGKSQKTGAG